MLCSSSNDCHRQLKRTDKGKKRSHHFSVAGLNLLCKEKKATDSLLGHSLVHFTSVVIRTEGWVCVQSAVHLGPILQGSVRWTGPAVPCAEGSVHPSVVRLPIHVEICFYIMCRDGLLIQRVGGLWMWEIQTERYTMAQDKLDGRWTLNSNWKSSGF